MAIRWRNTSSSGCKVGKGLAKIIELFRQVTVMLMRTAASTAKL